MSKKRRLNIWELINDKSFWQSTWVFPSMLFAATTGLLSFIDVELKVKVFSLIVLVVITCLYFIISVIKKSGLGEITLNLDGSNFEITVGDIFQQDSDDFKVIAFNEYFDTIVDENVISSTSLNGQYLMRNYQSSDDIQKLNDRIANDLRLQIKETDVTRKLGGNKTKYELGSVFKDSDYFLVAFSKFNEKNEANLRLTEYATCLLKFWSEVNALYSQKTVVIPLLGAGITRHRDFNATHQDLLEVLIWTFKISKVKFKEPSKIKVVIHESQKNEINFYKLKELEKNGI